MKKTIIAALVPLCVLFFTSCKKGGSNQPVVPPSADSYLPVTASSNWTYSDVISGTKDTIRLTMTGATTNIGGQTFYTASGKSRINPVITENYYSGNHLYIRQYSIGGGVYQTYISVTLLNDTVAAGNSFTASITPDGTLAGSPARIVNTVIEKNISKVVNGVTFSNVIHTHVDLQYNYGAGFATNSTYDYYLAKGVGIIEEDLGSAGSTDETKTLMNYSVK